MDDFQRLERNAYLYLMVVHGVLILFALNFFLIGTDIGFGQFEVAVADAIVTAVLAHIAARISARRVMQPFKMLWQAILHVAPDGGNVPAPNISKLKFGRELVVSLANRVYQFASMQDGTELAKHRETLSQAANVLSHFPQPLFVVNKELVVTNASDSALTYLGLTSPQLFGQRLSDSMTLEFPGESTLEQWMKECQTSEVTQYGEWLRVKVRLRDAKTVHLCDVAAYYDRENQSGTEFIITFFDRSAAYGQDEQALSFVALAVHELRTPLTMLRGYIEALDEELAGKLNEQQADYARKLKVSADQLTAFVTNVLNVVKIEEGQLSLNLVEKDWGEVLNGAIASQQLRAKVMGKEIKLQIDGKLPTVAVDPVSISEVINNLLDNAIKYSRGSNQIEVASHVTQDGTVETTVTDHGVGIPESVLPNLFEKFYRNHRTRNQIGGTGLGLYLSKQVVDAHGGQIWVRSKPGEGSTFGFNVKPYAQLAEELKNKDNSDITRHAHGWIKNHSMNRR